VEPRSALQTLDDAVAEFKAYIANGYRYELRALYTTAPQPQPKRQVAVRGAYLNKSGGVTLCAYGQEEQGYGFASLLYTAPQPQREWVGLSEQDIARIKQDAKAIFYTHPESLLTFVNDMIEWYDATLKVLREKNGGGV
jgi:hypothetical protein